MHSFIAFALSAVGPVIEALRGTPPPRVGEQHCRGGSLGPRGSKCIAGHKWRCKRALLHEICAVTGVAVAAGALDWRQDVGGTE